MSTKSDTSTTAIAMVFLVPCVVAVVVPFLLWSGWAVTILWGWFVVLALLPGWERSLGVSAELALAKNCGLDVIHVDPTPTDTGGR